MTKCILPFLAMLITGVAQAQHSFKAYIKDKQTHEPLAGAIAVLSGTANGASADVNGFLTIKNIPDGQYIINFSILSYETLNDTFTFPLVSTDTLEIFLVSETTEMGEVVISSTRSSRTIENIPTRIEFIAGEELEEKANMKPGDIRMLLNESTGIQIQQTSATSANSSIRIQGLDGRYTQILKDGFPLYSGASSGLGLLQTPPLDLKQVEIIKGSASTLYGGGAIAGLVNLISKTPTEKRELRFHVNGTSALGLDINGFCAQRFKKVGVTLFASHNSNAPYDPANIGLTAIPKFQRYILNPKLFFYLNERTKLVFGINTAFENRIGGDIHYIKGEGDTSHSYFEKNDTKRISTQLSFQHTINEKSHITIRNSYNNFHRIITTPGYEFDGLQNSTFSEMSYVYSGKIYEWITGVNLLTDHFTENQFSTFPLRNYDQTTIGGFLQNTAKATDWLSLESGIRGDYVLDYGFAFLPRMSALFKMNSKLSSRIGWGLGYKAPTIFTEESERIQYQNVLPINSSTNTLEKSYGVNADINYRTAFNERITFSINQLFFYTKLNSPLILTPLINGTYQFINSNGYIDTKGTETNIKLGYEDFKLFLGYSFTDAIIYQGATERQNPLTAKHRINTIFMYEVEDKWKVGLEAYYYSPQKLSDGTTGREYWIFGAMAEKLWGNLSIYINFENYTDTRQTRFGSIYTGTITTPTFKDIYAPLDGFVINTGVKIKL